MTVATVLQISCSFVPVLRNPGVSVYCMLPSVGFARAVQGRSGDRGGKGLSANSIQMFELCLKIGEAVTKQHQTFAHRQQRWARCSMRRDLLRCVYRVCLSFSLIWGYETNAFTAVSRRSFATIAPDSATTNPVRRYGGLKDQDRIFTNAYCKHDHGLKGAKVSHSSVS